jgi:hypothetical protein
MIMAGIFDWNILADGSNLKIYIFTPHWLKFVPVQYEYS